MKILFDGLGPNDTVTLGNKTYRNGSCVDIDEVHAKAFLDCNIAKEVKTEEDAAEVVALQNLEAKNAKTRQRVENKVEQAKEGGEK
jgi:hypothetical protein